MIDQTCHLYLAVLICVHCIRVMWRLHIIIIIGMDVTLVVNNLGGTSYLELYLMANAAVRYLSKTKLNFVRYYYSFDYNLDTS